MAWLASQENAQSVGLKFAVRQRVNISANPDGSAKNLLFSEKGKSGALGRDSDGNIYYMANIRGRGQYPSFPLTCKSVGISKDGKLMISIEYQTVTPSEIDTIKGWINKTAKATLQPRKATTTTTTETVTSTEPEPVHALAPTPATVQSVSVNGEFDESKLTLLQKAVRKKAIELGLYNDEATANLNYDSWKNTTMKELA